MIDWPAPASLTMRKRLRLSDDAMKTTKIIG
jgi:hypothetical protein